MSESIWNEIKHGLRGAIELQPSSINAGIGNYEIRAIRADKINAGTIDASLITVTNLDASNITAGSLSCNYLSGGTLSLGGTANSNGVFSLKDEGGTEKIAMNKDGLTVYNGQVTIQDAAGSTVIDSGGLNSVNTFQSGQALKTSNQNWVSGTYAYVDGLSATLALDRPAQVLIMSSVTGYHYDADGLLICQLHYNGTAIGPEWIAGAQVAMAQVSITGATSYIYSAPAGTGTIQVWARQNNSPGTAVIEASFLNSVLNYVVLGK